VNSSEARQILLCSRPGGPDGQDPELVQALELTRQDPELRAWYEQHCAFQASMRSKFRQIDVPADLKARILAGRKVIRPRVWWRNPVWLAAAAVVVLFLGVGALLLQPRTPDRFADYEARMIGAALRQYRMDLVTNDMRQIRQFMAAGGAPSDYVVPKGLDRLQLTGGGLLRWRNNPVSMVCFDRGGNQMLFLFVMNRSAVKDPPPATPRVGQVNKLQAAAWTAGDKTYLLAGPKDDDFARKYL
jgi:hypothetical protein